MENRQLAELIRRYHPFEQWLEEGEAFKPNQTAAHIWAVVGVCAFMVNMVLGLSLARNDGRAAWFIPIAFVGVVLMVLNIDATLAQKVRPSYRRWRARRRRTYEQQLRENPYSASLILKTVKAIETETSAKRTAAEEAVGKWLKVLTDKHGQLAEIAGSVRADLDGGFENDPAVRDLLAAAEELLPQLQADISEAQDYERRVPLHYQPVEQLVGQLRQAYRRSSQVEAVAEAQALLGTDRYRLDCQTKIGDLQQAVVQATLDLEKITDYALARLQAQQEVDLTLPLTVDVHQGTSA